LEEWRNNSWDKSVEVLKHNITDSIKGNEALFDKLKVQMTKAAPTNFVLFLGKLLRIACKPSSLAPDNILASCIQHQLGALLIQNGEHCLQSDVAAFAIVDLIHEDFRNLFGCSNDFESSVSCSTAPNSHNVSIDVWRWSQFISNWGVRVFEYPSNNIEVFYKLILSSAHLTTARL
jgi:hypothetical protein